MQRLQIPTLLLFALFAVRGSAYAQVNHHNIDAEFVKATELHQAGNIEGAITAYLKILSKQPDRSDVRSNLGAAYSKLGRYNEAITHYNQALKYDPDNITIKFNLGLSCYKASLYSDAVRVLEPVIKTIADNDQNKYIAIMITSDSLIRLGEYKKVINILTPLEVTRGEDRSFAFLLGSALISDGQLDKGHILIDRVFKNDESAEAHLLLGSILLEADDGFGAQKELERAIELNPKLAGLQSRYGRALLRLGDSEKAALAFRHELEFNPNDFDANVFLGMLLKRDKQTEEAHKYLSHAIQLRPRDAYAQYHLGSNYSVQGKFKEALPILEKVVNDYPQFTDARSLLALVCYRLGRKADGDNHQAIAQKQIAEKQAKQPGAQE